MKGIKSMKKNIFIHIGPHKTGTSTIQHGLFLNEKFLKTQGVLCPKVGRPFPTTAAHHNLAWELLKREPPNDRYNPKFGNWKKFLRSMKRVTKQENVVISSEEFCEMKLSQIQELGNILSDYNVKIIIYLRRQDQILQSLWVEIVKNGYSAEVDSFYDWLQKYKYNYPNMNYSTLIKNWSRVFGEENMIIRILEKSQIENTLFYDFLSAININSTNYIEPPNANVSPGVRTIEAIRLIKRNIKFNRMPKRLWNKLVSFIINYGNENGWDHQKVNYISDDLSKEIMKVHEDRNMYIANEFFGRTKLFFDLDLKDGEISTFMFTDFSKEELILMYSAVVDYLVKQISL